MNLRFLFAALILIALICGCGIRDDFTLTIDDFKFEERRETPFPTNGVKQIAMMMSNDVIVAVNGYPLRKSTYDDVMELRAKGIYERNPNTSQLVAENMMSEYRVGYIKNFQGQRMLVDEAFREGVVTTNEVISTVVERLKELARKRGKTVEDSLKKYGDKRKYLFQEMFISIVMDKFIAARIPPTRKIDPKFVAAAQKQIAADNEAAEVTNKLLQAHLRDWKNQIITNKLDFTVISARFSAQQDPEGVWGTFEEGTMDDPRIEAKAFALPLNGISDVLEDDNGYYLVKVLAITPAEKDEAGKVVTKESRKLSRIYFEKLPISIRETDIQLTHSLKQQMQMRAINEYVNKLSTNGTVRIEFPHGQKLF